MLEGVKPSACSDSVGLSGGGTRAGGNMPPAVAEADAVDRRALRPELAFAAVSALLERDARVGGRAVQGGDMVERAEAGDRGADVAAIEQVRAADRLSLRVERGVR